MNRFLKKQIKIIINCKIKSHYKPGLPYKIFKYCKLQKQQIYIKLFKTSGLQTICCPLKRRRVEIVENIILHLRTLLSEIHICLN